MKLFNKLFNCLFCVSESYQEWYFDRKTHSKHYYIYGKEVSKEEYEKFLDAYSNMDEEEKMLLQEGTI